ncbi:NupC/NupG family nucleoside CNT transporter, partial [Candidatus Omnitrophota bacterium]
RSVNWRVIFWGLALQFAFAFFIFRMPAGVAFFGWINNIVIKLLSFAKSGAYFLFGPLAVGPGEAGPHGERSVGFILAFQALPTIIFFSSLMALFYYLRIMPVIVNLFARAFRKLMRISGAESLCAASNIFVGIESAFTIRPYIDRMTPSELCTILTAGMSTIASSMLAIYVVVLKGQFPEIAGHLISASILSAPAAIIMSKMVYPELGCPATMGKAAAAEYHPSSGWVEAVIKGANEGVKLVVGIVALLLAFLGIAAMADWALSAAGSAAGNLAGLNIDLSLEGMLGYVFYPLTILIGIPAKDAPVVSQLLGERVILTEVVAYQHLAGYIKSGALKDPRSIVLATYSLCGFAHIASLAIFVGGISGLAPGRMKDLARLGFRALLAASLACLMTGAVAGVFFRGGATVLMKGM